MSQIERLTRVEEGLDRHENLCTSRHQEISNRFLQIEERMKEIETRQTIIIIVLVIIAVSTTTAHPLAQMFIARGL